ncbi:MAG: S1C family serine protease [Spirochaetaceae bacterium]|nr:S1C family serine protease [Spirochaetaceae bacterium]
MRAKYNVFIVFTVLTFTSCATRDTAEKRLTPPKTANMVRLEEIEKYAQSEPLKAIHLIGVYKSVYNEKNATVENQDETDARLNKLYEISKNAILELQINAINEKKWDVAASLSRSLAVLGVFVEKTGQEPEILIQAAKDYLSDGKELQAFLAAVQSHNLKPLSPQDALVFLEHSVKAHQRRTANFFLTAIDKQGGITVPSPLRAFAEGTDSTSEMVKGVATVLVDRGIRVEHGMGSPDRVLGSAFFVDSGGLLITNYHVISSEVDPSYKGYSRLSIRTGDSTSPRVPAKVIGWDKTMDLALIKAEITPEYVFSVVDRIVPQVGGTVLAIGSPGGLEKTVTSGIVSARGRRFLQIGDVIQIDAAVNHGNSGGPVIDTHGRLVGIVFAGVEQFEGLNFAVPAERLAAALPAMLKGGKSIRPWLGLTLAQTREGAEIIYVAPLTPAAEQSVAEGVFIESLNGEKITAPQGELIAALQDRLFSDEPGELVALKTSDGKKYILQTAQRPVTPLAEAAKTDSRERIAAALFGLVLSPAGGSFWTPQYLIKRVVRGSVADEAGLSPQDPVRIFSFNLQEKEGYALLGIDVKKRSSGYMETTMRLPAALDSPDTL